MTLPHLFTIFEDVDCEHSEFERSGPEESDWLGAAPADGTTLIEFAQDGTGASFCLLQRMGVAIDQAPVVYLGSEGDVTPVAVNPEAFLDFVGAQLTLTAYDDEPELHDELEDEEDEDERNGIKERRAKVRRAFEAKLGRPLREPQAILSEARAALPDFRAWVDANVAT